jgi:hypothetical protein
MFGQATIWAMNNKQFTGEQWGVVCGLCDRRTLGFYVLPNFEGEDIKICQRCKQEEN